MREERFDIFDAQNRYIGQETRSRVHKEGLFHRSVVMFIFNNKGEVFLQQRSAAKDICSLAWDVSATGHLRPGEEYNAAARRELEEELGITPALARIRDIHLRQDEFKSGQIKDREFVVLYRAVWDGQVTPDETEVKTGKFFAVEEVARMAKGNKQSFTPWFLDEWAYLVENNLI